MLTKYNLFISTNKRPVQYISFANTFLLGDDLNIKIYSWAWDDFGDWGALASSNITNFYISEISLVPIPTTMFLLGSGLIGIVGIRRKMK